MSHEHRYSRFHAAIAALLVVLAAAVTISQTTAPDYRAAGPQWYKGNLHTHTLWSDGNDFPEMVVDWYKRSGYQFLAISDHNIVHEGEKWIDPDAAAKRGAIDALPRYQARFAGDDWVETRQVVGKTQVRLKPLEEYRPLFEEAGRFLLMPSEEISDAFKSLPIHLNVTNIRDVIRPQGGGSVRETIANNLQAIEQQSLRHGRPMLAHLNHPNYGYAVTAEDMAHVLQERFFEVYNGHPSINHRGDARHPPVESLWDIANTIRIAELQAQPLFGLATDDSHNYFGQRGASPGRGWVMVRAARLTPASLIASLQRGDFYASSGVTLKRTAYDATAKTLEVEIDATEGESYTTQFIGTLEGYNAQTSEVFDVQGKPLPVTRKYSDDVGKVLATMQGAAAKYKLSGKELYVRAVVSSDKPPENPCFEGQVKQAWTQPVGWEGRVAKPVANVQGAVPKDPLP